MTAKQIIDRLKAAGYSQYRIAKAAGLSASVVSLLASGERSDCKASTLAALQAAEQSLLAEVAGE